MSFKSEIETGVVEVPATLSAILSVCRAHGSKSEQAFVEVLMTTLHPYGAEQDRHGNIWVTTNNDSETLFTCHTDSVHSLTDVSQKVLFDANFCELFKDDGRPLGADDGAGIWLMLEMIEAGVPGTYIFFRGEERGGIGSSGASGTEDFSWAKRAIAFDRKGFTDVITHQGCGRCCSDDFAAELAKRLGMGYEPSDEGVFTDTANLIDVIGECTNISVGYRNEHSSKEVLNVPHLLQLRDAVLKVDWETLPAVRQPGETERFSRFSQGYWEEPEPVDELDVIAQWCQFLRSCKKLGIKVRRVRVKSKFADDYWKLYLTVNGVVQKFETFAGAQGYVNFVARSQL